MRNPRHQPPVGPLAAFLLALLLPLTSWAARQGHYHPDEVAARSARFQELSQAFLPRFDALQGQLARAGEALQELERAVLLLGDRAPEGLRTWQEDLRRRAAHAHLTAQAHVDLVQQDAEQTFGRALQRALEALDDDWEVQECRRSPLPGPAAGPACPGEDLNDRLAKALDADPVLEAEVRDMLSVPWPEFQLEGAPQPAVPFTGEDGYIRLAAVAEALVGERIEAMADELDRRLAAVAGDLERAYDLRAAWERDMAALGDTLLQAIERPLKRHDLEVALCANPPALGGCPGVDRTDEALALLVDDRRVRRALSR